MLDHECKEFLTFLQSHQPDYGDEVYTYDWIEKNYSKPIESVYRMVRYLEKIDYVKVATLNTSHFGIVLEQKGYCYNEYKFLDVFAFFCRSILTPIGVSIITTLIVLWIQSAMH